MTSRMCLRVGAGFAFLAVLLGAFGAHALRDRLAANGMIHTWETAVLYHFIHSLGLLLLGPWKPVPKWPARLFVVGIALFSGSLYLLAVTGYRPLGGITPFGGVAFLVGWGLIVFPKPSGVGELANGG